ncbi:hypothetical protein [Plantibacter sp. YIM 135347]|uniref:hypothetical protein n=1 Tax=Plantibacter sp. YIM 135347 TaxID=3423919 RepID=UPI003D32F085
MGSSTESAVGEFFMKVGMALVLAMVAGGALWFSGFFSEFGVPGVLGETGYSDDFTRPAPDDVEPQPQVPVDMPVTKYWSCGWSPTMNEDWHDDVLCTQENEAIRPSLLTDWDFVTYDDMMAAAREYEAELNQGPATQLRAPAWSHD